MDINLFLACLSTSIKLLHNYKLIKSIRKECILHASFEEESELFKCTAMQVDLCRDMFVCFEENERCRFFTFNAVTSFALASGLHCSKLPEYVQIVYIFDSEMAMALAASLERE